MIRSNTFVWVKYFVLCCMTLDFKEKKNIADFILVVEVGYWYIVQRFCYQQCHIKKVSKEDKFSGKKNVALLYVVSKNI